MNLVSLGHKRTRCFGLRWANLFVLIASAVFYAVVHAQAYGFQKNARSRYSRRTVPITI